VTALKEIFLVFHFESSSNDRYKIRIKYFCIYIYERLLSTSLFLYKFEFPFRIMAKFLPRELRSCKSAEEPSCARRVASIA
jgi:hypothetical protein